MAEIVRRNPSELRILETHPGAGLFDCLGITDTGGRRLASLNRSGTLRLLETMDGEKRFKSQSGFFEGLFAGKNFPKAVSRICRELGIPSYKSLPPTTRESLVYRFIAALLESSVFSGKAWECRNGYFETTGLGEGVRPDFAAFPLAKKRLLASEAARQGGRSGAYDYWFIRINGKPELCLSMEALAWDADFNETDLFVEYRKGRRIWPLVLNTAGVLLP